MSIKRFIVYFILSMAIVSCSSKKQNNLTKIVNDKKISLLICTNKSYYSVKELIYLDVKVINTSDNVINIYSLFPNYSLFIDIINQNGHKLQYIGGVLKLGTGDYYKTLLSYECLGKIFILNEPEYGMYNIPKGKYRVIATLGDDKHQDYCNVAYEEGKYCAPISSNEIIFKVF